MSDTGNDETSEPEHSNKAKWKHFTKRGKKAVNETRNAREILPLAEDETKAQAEETRRLSSAKSLPENEVLTKMAQRAHRLSSVGNVQRGRPKLGHTPAPALDVELKKVLMNDSLASTTVSQEGKKRKRRKLELLELARSEAEIIEIMKKFADEKSDPEDELTCCRSRKAKEKKALEEFGESSEEEGFRISRDEVLMSKAQRIAKWLVSAVAALDFFIAAQDTFNILIRKMQIEYLFMAQVYNCSELIGSGDIWLIWANCIHAFVSVGLLYMENRNTSAFGIYWLISQSLRTFLLIFEAFFRSRFKSNFITIFLSFLWWRVPLDLLQMGIVLFRYYKLNNPFPERLKALATEIHLDRPLNNELRLRDSTFLQSKFRLREAAAFQTLEIIRKVKKAGRDSRMRNRVEIIRAEIVKAINILKNPKRYPMKLTRAEEKYKEERVDNDDNVTILDIKSTASVLTKPDTNITSLPSKANVQVQAPGKASKANVQVQAPGKAVPRNSPNT